MTVQQRTRLLFVILLLAGGGAVGVSGYGLAGVAAALDAQAPVVALDGIDAAAFMAGVAMLAIAAVCLLPASDPAARPGKGARQRGTLNLGPLLMLFAAACMVLCPLAPTITRAMVGASAQGRGYVACPRLTWPRRQPDRWALPTPAGPQARCPQQQQPPS